MFFGFESIMLMKWDTLVMVLMLMVSWVAGLVDTRGNFLYGDFDKSEQISSIGFERFVDPKEYTSVVGIENHVWFEVECQDIMGWSMGGNKGNGNDYLIDII